MITEQYYPQRKSIICTTYGYSGIAYPERLTNYIKSLGIGMYEGECELPDRAACARAGIITYGKNNFAYTKEDGSFHILNTFLVDTALDYDAPTVRFDCPAGCTKCMDACPTKSILKPGRLAPGGCAMNVHQLPIGKFPPEMRGKFGTRIHGCDECQLACPHCARHLRSMRIPS